MISRCKVLELISKIAMLWQRELFQQFYMMHAAALLFSAGVIMLISLSIVSLTNHGAPSCKTMRSPRAKIVLKIVRALSLFTSLKVVVC